MAAVLECGSAETSRQATTRESRKSTNRKARKRQSAMYRGAIKYAFGFLAVVLLFGWMCVYAMVTATGINRSDISRQLRREQITNQRLKMRLDSLSCPQNVVIAAQKAGMVYATQYEYVGKPQTVASAGKGMVE